MFTRIVVGDDGSEGGQDAAVLAAAIARATGAGVTLLQAVPPALIPSPGYTDRHTLTRDANKQLSAHRRLFAPEAITDVFVDSQPSRALIQYAQDWHADLIVIGSNRRAADGHSAISRTGRTLVERAPAALAIAARGLHEREFRFTTVAVGYDGRAESELALSFADQIAAGADAELQIHGFAMERVPPFTTDGWIPAEALDELRDLDRNATLDVCRAAVAQTAARSRPEAAVGDPGYGLRDVSQHVDLMVIGSRRWGAVARLVLGGVGETLASDCGASLLITNRPLPHPNRTPLSRAGRETAGR